jgi:hypothetical protein
VANATKDQTLSCHSSPGVNFCESYQLLLATFYLAQHLSLSLLAILGTSCCAYYPKGLPVDSINIIAHETNNLAGNWNRELAFF